MDAKLLLIVCLALLGTVQGYTLRDILRERALRRLGEFDSNQPSDEEVTRALNALEEFHFKRMFDAEPNCRDANPDCAGHIYENGGPEVYCNDPFNWDYVKQHCKQTCNIDNCNGGYGDIKVPFPQQIVCKDEEQLKDLCRTIKEKKRCDASYSLTYCTKTCHPECRGKVNLM